MLYAVLCSRLILRLKLLESLKEEVIQDLGDMIMADTGHEEVPLDVPAVDSIDKPMEWWDEEADKSLLIGVYKHGRRRGQCTIHCTASNLAHHQVPCFEID